MLAAFLGFVSPWVGDVVGYFKSKQDNAHELAMLKETNATTRDVAGINADLGRIRADVDDVVSARASQQSYGVALLDAVRGGGWIERNVLKPLLVWSLAIVEVLNGLMRPWVVYLISGMWASSKAAQFYFSYNAALTGDDADAILVAMATAALDVWTERDYAFMEYVVGFLLGSRHKLKEAGSK